MIFFCLLSDMKKLLLLVLALFVPVVIYLFLQSFGENQYQLSILYQDEVPQYAGCNEVSAPYRLPKEYYEGVEYNAILIDVRLDDKNASFINNELARVRQYFGNPTFHYKLFGADMQGGTSEGYNTKNDMMENVRCTLLYETNNSFITLVDKQGRIRSYFDSSKKQEFDRLITEIEILNAFN